MNEKKKEFSLAMCVYGGDSPLFFKEALESINSQTRKPNEIVLTIDGPISKELEQVIMDYSRRFHNFKIIRLQHNMGHGEARRICINNCSKDYIAIADADDINLPRRFELEMECFERDNSLSLVGSSQKNFIDNVSNIVQVRRRPEKHEQIVELMKSQCPITQATVIFTKDIYNKAGGYIDWYCGEDYYLWVRMYESGAQFYNLPEPLVLVRTSKDQYKRRGGFKYFRSTYRLSKYMYTKKIISLRRHISNTVPRFILQVIMPAELRGFIRNHVFK